MASDSAGKQTEKNHTFAQSLRHAWAGVCQVLKQERNMRFHLVAAVLAVICGWWLPISTVEWLWLALAAGAVLCAASFAVVVGLLIFVPHLLKLLN